MKRFLFFIALIFSFSVNAQTDQAVIDKVVGPKPPASEGLVIDRAGMLTPEQKQTLNQKLIAYDDSTSNQIAVVIIPSLQDHPLEDIAIGILRNWGVGSKKNNNGIVLLISKEDRKIRIEVGYGLEGAINDVVSKNIIDDDMTPNFKEGNYYRGIDDATDDIMKAAAGEYQAPEGYNQRRGKKFPWGAILFVIIIIISLFSRGGGGRNGGMMSRRGFGGFWTGMILGNMLSGGGRGEWGSGGGGWSGGGGGGGFGGFGGGSGGGGGASGGW